MSQPKKTIVGCRCSLSDPEHGLHFTTIFSTSLFQSWEVFADCFIQLPLSKKEKHTWDVLLESAEEGGEGEASILREWSPIEAETLRVFLNHVTRKAEASEP